MHSNNEIMLTITTIIILETPDNASTVTTNMPNK